MGGKYFNIKDLIFVGNYFYNFFEFWSNFVLLPDIKPKKLSYGL